MRCPPALEVQSYIDGELMPTRAARVAGHLAHCRSCRGLAHSLASTVTLLRTLAEVPAKPECAFTAPARAIRPKANRLYWILLPGAACFLLAALVATWRLTLPVRGETAFLSAFIEAHRTLPTTEGIPVPCDFGLGGGWQ